LNARAFFELSCRLAFKPLFTEEHMNSIQLPVGENLLLAALSAVGKSDQVPSEDLVAQYERHFTTAISVHSKQPQVFERFSIIDPTVSLIVQSSTAAT
jgi:hypothetical protein